MYNGHYQLQIQPPVAQIDHQYTPMDRHTPPSNNESLSSISPNSSSSSSNSNRNSPAITHHQSTPASFQLPPVSTVWHSSQQNPLYPIYQSGYSYFPPSYNNYYEQVKASHRMINQSGNDSSYFSRNSSLNESSSVSTSSSDKSKSIISFSIERILAPSSKPNTNNQTFNKPTQVPCTFIEERKKKKTPKIDLAQNNKRIRTIFTQEQLDQLEVEFMRQQYMVGSERSYLAEKLGLTESQVKIWFQNRRIKWRKSQQGRGSSSSGRGNNDYDDEDENDENESRVHRHVSDADESNHSYSNDGSDCDE